MRVFNSPIYTSSHSPAPEKHTLQEDNNKALLEGKVQDEDKALSSPPNLFSLYRKQLPKEPKLGPCSRATAPFGPAPGALCPH